MATDQSVALMIVTIDLLRYTVTKIVAIATETTKNELLMV